MSFSTLLLRLRTTFSVDTSLCRQTVNITWTSKVRAYSVDAYLSKWTGLVTGTSSRLRTTYSIDTSLCIRQTVNITWTYSSNVRCCNGRTVTRRSSCCNGCHSRNRCSDGWEARVQVWAVLGAFSADEGLGRCPCFAAAAGEGCICGVGVGGETVSADEGLKAGSDNTLSAL